MAVVVVPRVHAQPAAATDQHTREQRAAGARGTVAPRHVQLHLGPNTLILLPGDVGRKAIRQKHFGCFHAGGATAGARATRLLWPSVPRPHSIDIRASINRIGEQIVQRGSVDAMPFQLALARPAIDAHRHAHVVLDQVTHHFADRAEALEQIEHQTDRRLGLLVGIEHHLAGRAPQIAHRHRLAEFAPPRLRTLRTITATISVAAVA